MRKVLAKLVPRLLNDDQKEHHMQVCQDIIERLQTELDLLRRVITGNETWIFLVRPGNQAQEQSVEVFDVVVAEETRTKSKVSIMLITFFDIGGIVRSRFLPQGQMINQCLQGHPAAYVLLGVRKETKVVAGQIADVSLRQCCCISQFRTERNITEREQPFYSSDLALCDFLFSSSTNGSSRELILKVWRPSSGP